MHQALGGQAVPVCRVEQRRAALPNQLLDETETPFGGQRQLLGQHPGEVGRRGARRLGHRLLLFLWQPLQVDELEVGGVGLGQGGERRRLVVTAIVLQRLRPGTHPVVLVDQRLHQLSYNGAALRRAELGDAAVDDHGAGHRVVEGGRRLGRQIGEHGPDVLTGPEQSEHPEHPGVEVEPGPVEGGIEDGAMAGGELVGGDDGDTGRVEEVEPSERLHLALELVDLGHQLLGHGAIDGRVHLDRGRWRRDGGESDGAGGGRNGRRRRLSPGAGHHEQERPDTGGEATDRHGRLQVTGSRRLHRATVDTSLG